jgi:hypothetical protein
MNQSLAGRVLRVHDDEMAGMAGVWARELEAVRALWAADQYRLAVAQLVEALEDMDSSQRNHLEGSAVGTGKGDLPKPGEHRQPGLGSKAG